jgi:hypothetical protein
MLRRKSLINKALRLRFVVTLAKNEGTFSGVLVESDPVSWVFDNCATVPDKPADAPKPIVGRVWVDRSQVSYMQEVNA